MDAMDILIKEHVHIKKVLAAIRRDCERLVEGGRADPEFYRKVIDFVCNFADKYHHQKEEKKLFNIMAEGNEMLKNGPIMGMLLEHDMGRMYIKNLEEEVNKYEKGDMSRKAYIVANALAYEMLLRAHIQKEDTAIYMTARRLIPKDVQENLYREFEDIEADEENTKIREKYISFADNL